MNIKKKESIKGMIPTASMADIAFLLIIFFMVSSVFPLDKTQMDLPETAESMHYREDSALISITTDQLKWVRENTTRHLRDIVNRPETVRVKVSDVTQEASEIYQHPASSWDLTDPSQFDALRNQIRDFLRRVERRRETEGIRFIIVMMVDKKTPFFALDGVVQALQDLGGEAAQSVAILSKPIG